MKTNAIILTLVLCSLCGCAGSRGSDSPVTVVNVPPKPTKMLSLKSTLSDAVQSVRADSGAASQDSRSFVRAVDDKVRPDLEQSLGRKIGPVAIDNDPLADKMYSNYAELLADVEMHTETFLGSAAAAIAHTEVLAIVPHNEFCTATVIAQNAIATAAHCAKLGPKTIFIGNDVATAKPFTLGKNKFIFLSDGGTDLDVAVLLVPDLESITGVQDPDLPVFAPATAIADAKNLTIIGFGGYGSNSSLPGTKRLGIIPMASPDCTPEEAAHFQCHPGFDMVAGARPLEDRAACPMPDPQNPQHGACKGDSGGPAYVVGADNRLLLAGLIRSVHDIEECGCEATANVYVRFDKLEAKLTAIKDIHFTKAAFALVDAAAGHP